MESNLGKEKSEKEETLQSKKVWESMNWEPGWDNKMFRWTYRSKGARKESSSEQKVGCLKLSFQRHCHYWWW